MPINPLKPIAKIIPSGQPQPPSTVDQIASDVTKTAFETPQLQLHFASAEYPGTSAGQPLLAPGVIVGYMLSVPSTLKKRRLFSVMYINATPNAYVVASLRFYLQDTEIGRLPFTSLMTPSATLPQIFPSAGYSLSAVGFGGAGGNTLAILLGAKTGGQPTTDVIVGQEFDLKFDTMKVYLEVISAAVTDIRLFTACLSWLP